MAEMTTKLICEAIEARIREAAARDPVPGGTLLLQGDPVENDLAKVLDANGGVLRIEIRSVPQVLIDSLAEEARADGCRKN